MLHDIRNTVGATIILCVITLAGCGGSLPASVEGTVTLDGAPLSTGAVVFYPVAGGPAVHGQVGHDGSYALTTGTSRGLQTGEYSVTVMCRRGDPTLDMSMEEIDALDITPTRYRDRDTTDLRFSVNPGKNQINIGLSSE